MTIPNYQSLMLPILKICGDGAEHQMSDVTIELIKFFEINSGEQKELLPSGKQPIFLNRVGWAKTYLKKAGLVETPKRAVVKITDQGKHVLEKNPVTIDLQLLGQFESFREFRYGMQEGNPIEPQATLPSSISSKSPQDQLEQAYSQIRNLLAADAISRVKEMSPLFFEKLVVKLIVAMGYGGTEKDAGKAIGQSGDEGIDGIVKEDRLGLDVIYLQAKRWEGVVGCADIQKFVGALAGQKAKKGIFLATSRFTDEAKSYASKVDSKVILNDGVQLAQLMIDYNVGVSTDQVFELKKIDEDFFVE